MQGALLQGLLHKLAINILAEDGMLVERYVLQSQVYLVDSFSDNSITYIVSYIPGLHAGQCGQGSRLRPP